MILNLKEMIYAIGDIHGCAQELELLLAKIAPKSDDTVVFLGDYIDRGPDSKGVIDVVISLKKKCHVVALKGNHESLFLDFLESPQSVGAGLFILNGGSTTLASYAGPGGTFEIPESHIKFLYGLKPLYETEDFFFVHAGVPIRALSTIHPKNDEQALLWSRQPFLSSDFKWEKRIVHGHTPVQEPEIKSNRINVDTGAVYNGFLTAVELPTGRFIQVRRDPSLDKSPSAIKPDGDRVAVRFNGRLTVQVTLPSQDRLFFETLNYNQFGLLMREAGDHAESPLLHKGQIIEGMIGSAGPSAIQFQGVVARIETRSQARVYGVSLQRVTNGNEGREWIERPLSPAPKRATGK